MNELLLTPINIALTKLKNEVVIEYDNEIKVV
jgi:hypothetical protein